MLRARILVLVSSCASFAALSTVGCNTYSQSLARSRDAYEQNQHERALAILRALEPDENHLTLGEQAEYAYLRGMTDYRIGYQADARHWLAVAREIDTANPKSLTDDWKTRTNDVLEELNKRVYNEGLDSLANTPPKGDDDANDKKGPKKKPVPKPDDPDKNPEKGAVNSGPDKSTDK